MFLNISQNSQESTCTRVSFFIKLQTSGLQLYLKRDSGTGVFCEFCEFFRKTFFIEHLWRDASDFSLLFALLRKMFFKKTPPEQILFLISDTKVWGPDHVRYNFQNRTNAFPRQCKHDIKESIYKFFYRFALITLF